MSHKSEDELPELPDDILHELPDLPDLPELPEEPKPVPVVAETAPVESAPEPTAHAPLAPGEKPPLRDLQGAPLHLQKAALICFVGGVLPWQSLHVSTWMTWGLGKVLIMAGVWLLWKSVDHRSGGNVPGFVASLGDIVLGKKAEVDPKMAARQAARAKGPAKLDVAFPSALHIVGLLIVVIGCLMPLFDGGHNPAFEAKLKTLAELGMFAWAAGTWVHIYAYERWGSFNPIFPLIFIGMLVAGFATAIQAILNDNGIDPVGLLGGLAVGIGGGMAAYTIVEAMMDAKREGDAKKLVEADRRKAARSARKTK